MSEKVIEWWLASFIGCDDLTAENGVTHIE